MQLLELPLDVFRLIILTIVRDQGRAFSEEILNAVILARIIDDVVEPEEIVVPPPPPYIDVQRLEPHFDLTARYLHHRVRTDGPDTHAWILTIRETSDLLAKHTASWEDPVPLEKIQSSACLFLAVNAGALVYHVILQSMAPPYTKEHRPGGMWENCLAVAAWMQDLKLIRSLLDSNATASDADASPDPFSFFGRPSWAAAANGNMALWEFFTNRGALPFEPTYEWTGFLHLGKSPIRAAAYMGHDSMVRMILQAGHYQAREDVDRAIQYAAYGNRPQVLMTLLEHYRHTHGEADLQVLLDHSLVHWSCRRGAPDTTRVLLEYGANPEATNTEPRSCLQLATATGNAMTVKALLDAGAALEAPRFRLLRGIDIDSYRRELNTPRGKGMSALDLAKKRQYVDIVRLIEEREREMPRTVEA
ncbi:uncharacterized protein PG998_000019 [Apiospora kogelbergensis]|uniref:uncharacterized protein n=1 Tax=Apiospora kogelbergensis TaxID=1337665 RepID=UPI003131CB43